MRLNPSLREPSWRLRLRASSRECSNEQPRAKPPKKTTPITQEQKQALWALFRTSTYAHDALRWPGRARWTRSRPRQLTYTQCARQYGIYRRSKRDDVCHTLSPAAHATRVRVWRHAAQPAAVDRPRRGLRAELAAKVPLPVVANARAGCWYAHTKHVARFKDHGRPPRAVGLVATTTQSGLPAHCGGSRRRPPGRRDAARAVLARSQLSKAVPIWCCCVNRAAGFAEELCLPPCVAEEEARYKSAPGRLRFIDEAARARFEISRSRSAACGSSMVTTPPRLHSRRTPRQLSACRRRRRMATSRARPTQEAWAPPGFTADVFWRNPHILEEASDDAVEAAVAAAAAAAPAAAPEERSLRLRGSDASVLVYGVPPRQLCLPGDFLATLPADVAERPSRSTTQLTTSTPSTRLVPRRRRASPSARGGPGGRRVLAAFDAVVNVAQDEVRGL